MAERAPVAGYVLVKTREDREVYHLLAIGPSHWTDRDEVLMSLCGLETHDDSHHDLARHAVQFAAIDDLQPCERCLERKRALLADRRKRPAGLPKHLREKSLPSAD